MTGVGVRYTAFGAMAVSVDGVEVPLTRRRERGVLAVLLAAHGAPVAADRLLVEVWGADAPGQTLATLQVAVSRLRSTLDPGRAARTPSPLRSGAAGYSLGAGATDVDTWAFEAMAVQALAAETAGERLRCADEARALWTAPPYADADAPLVRAEQDRLAELATSVHEVRARALLDLGRPQDALLGTSELAPQHPYRERVWALLALAQYQCARQADALETLRRLRERLADDLGVDPSEEVQRLEQALLRQDPELAPRATPAPQRAAPAPQRAAPTPPAPPSRTPGAPGSGTVGRDGVLADALRLLEESRTLRRPRLLLVAGEPGIGKSRLVADLSSGAAARGAEVLVGRCREGEYAPALWPWLAVVRALADDRDDPLLAPLLRDDVVGETGGNGTGLRMFDAVARLVRDAAASHPLVVVLEDLHWADASSLLLLRHLVDGGLDGPVLLVGTRRTVEPTTSAPLVDAMAALARAGAERVHLDGLGTAAVAALLERSLGAHDPRLDDFVGQVSGGNPFFVLQYARQLAGVPHLDRLDPSSLPVPDGIRDVLGQRVGRLPDEVVRGLACAAVLGSAIDPDLLAAVTGSSVDECLDLLDLAVTTGLVEERGGGYAFVHALARETLYTGLSAARRMRLHDKAGRVLEQTSGVEVDGARAADLAASVAHHAHLAAPLGAEHAARACRWLAVAAGVATGRHAHAEALELFRRMQADATPGSVTMIEGLCGAAAALLRLARTVEGRAAVDEAVHLARDLGRWDLVARAAAIYNGAGVWSWREHGVQDHAFIEVLTEAARHVEDPERARLLAALQMEHFYGWDSSVGERIGAESVEVARRCGDPALLVEVLLVRIIAAWGPGRAPLRLRLVEEVLGHGPTGELRVFILFQLATAYYELFDPERADATMLECAREAAALRHTGVEIPLAWWRFARARDLDDPEAPALGTAASALHRASGYIAGPDLECLLAIRGTEAGGRVPDHVLELMPGANAGLRAMVAHACLEAGDPTTARRLLGEPAPPGASDYSVLAGHCLRVLVLAAAGPPAEVAAALERIVPHAGQSVVYGTVDHLGSVDLFLACGYAALGPAYRDRALEHARAAVTLNARLQCLPWARRAEALLARLG